MEFIKEIKILENTLKYRADYITYPGKTPVLLTALDTMDIYNPDGTIIDAPRFLKAIARYTAAYTDSSYFIKISSPDNEHFLELNNFIETNCIKIVLDINITKDNNKSIKIVPLNNVDNSILKELSETFKEHNISNIELEKVPSNDTEIDFIKIELPEKYRDITNPLLLEDICEALISFIKLYINIAE